MDNRMKTIMATVLVATLVAGALFMSGCVGPTEEEVTDVTVMMPFLANSEWTAFYTALNNGYYADEGLNVAMLYTSEGGFGSVKQVAAGKTTFGYAGGDSIIMGRSRDLPIVAVHQMEHSDQFRVIVKKESPITEPADLDGKTIAIIGPGCPPDIRAKAILTNVGVDYNNVSFVPVGSALLPALLQDKADAIAGWVLSEVILKDEGVDFRTWCAKDYGANFAGCAIITNEKTLEKNPEIVRKFVRATDKGFKYAMDHPEEAVDAYIKNFNPEAKKSRGIELTYWERLTNEVYQPNKYPSGEFNKSQWVITQDALYDMGMIEKKTDVDKMYTSEFVKELRSE